MNGSSSGEEGGRILPHLLSMQVKQLSIATLHRAFLAMRELGIQVLGRAPEGQTVKAISALVTSAVENGITELPITPLMIATVNGEMVGIDGAHREAGAWEAIGEENGDAFFLPVVDLGELSLNDARARALACGVVKPSSALQRVATARECMPGRSVDEIATFCGIKSSYAGSLLRSWQSLPKAVRELVIADRVNDAAAVAIAAWCADAADGGVKAPQRAEAIRKVLEAIGSKKRVRLQKDILPILHATFTPPPKGKATKAGADATNADATDADATNADATNADATDADATDADATDADATDADATDADATDADATDADATNAAPTAPRKRGARKVSGSGGADKGGEQPEYTVEPEVFAIANATLHGAFLVFHREGVKLPSPSEFADALWQAIAEFPRDGEESPVWPDWQLPGA